MKRILQLLAFVALAFATNQAYAQVGIGTETAHRSSVLELKAQGRGLLIPRVELVALTSSSPIHGDPANSLLVYNEKVDANANLDKGFYYWVSTGVEEGYWEAFLTNKNLDNKAGDGIYIDEDGKINIDTRLDDTSANHTVGGNKVLVTVEDTQGHTTTEWIGINDLLNEINANNGITINNDDPANPIIQLGGTLIKNTEIVAGVEIDGVTPVFKVVSGGDKFEVTGLTQVDGTAATFTNDFDVMIVSTTGVVQKVNVVDLFNEVIGAENGLKFDANSETIKLGGDLIEATEIELKGFEFKLTAEGTGSNVVIDADDKDAEINIATNATTPNLEITGLKEFERDAVRETLVLDADNKVRTVTTQEVALLTALDLTDASSGYEDYIKVIYIEVPVTDLSSAKTITLPAASNDNIGQVIEVKITGENDAQNDLEIKVGATTLGYGAVANQKWTIRSFGTAWKVVSNF